MEDYTHTTILRALSTLTQPQLTTLTTTLLTTFHHHRRRLASLLSSPPLFTHTLNHLHSLSLPQKSLLLARLFLSFLLLLLLPAPSRPRLRLLDLDSALLLLLFCDTRQFHPSSLNNTPPSLWPHALASHFISHYSLLALPSDALLAFIDLVTKCRRLVTAKGRAGDVAGASVGAVVGLASVQSGGRVVCAICREEVGVGRELCELPCQHLYHWGCVLTWFSTRNTCPCCRFRLPTDDVYAEIERVWDVVVKLAQRQVCDTLEK